jgi:CheY-like chemotaxis protein
MDDEEPVRVVCERLLSRLGFAVKTARHGAEALELARSAVSAGSPFNVAILDLTIPGGLGGAEIADQLRHESPATRLVVSSGHEQQGCGEWNGRLNKPYRLDELSAVLRRALE